MKKKSLNEVLMANCTNNEEYNELKAWVYKIPFFKDREEVTIELLETFLDKMCRKHGLMVSSYMPCHLKNEILWYSVPVKRIDTQECVKIISAATMREAMMKASLFMFAYVKKYNPKGVE